MHISAGFKKTTFDVAVGTGRTANDNVPVVPSRRNVHGSANFKRTLFCVNIVAIVVVVF
ncbi:MAG: hypothetical protein ACTSVZ_10040 [Promethearchaeota archaeon]